MPAGVGSHAAMLILKKKIKWGGGDEGQQQIFWVSACANSNNLG